MTKNLFIYKFILYWQHVKKFSSFRRSFQVSSSEVSTIAKVFLSDGDVLVPSFVELRHQFIFIHRKW